ncbi:MAG: 4'-phosphopantetheinyl transferase superfamily protein [Chitinophagaceae bacterium]|nr:4'-phosphopantetheinyl transferase superfamily protein [Chitinophagaceae bacterium]
MTLVYQHTINSNTKLGLWRIEEPEEFFLAKVPLKRDVTHPHKRLQHLAGRCLLPTLFEDFPLQEILIADTRKPFLPDEQYHFSISHCGNYAAAIASSEQRVGIDIEIPTEKIFRIIHKFLNEEEKQLLNEQMSSSQLLQTATLLWSAKEAMFKWWGNGEVDFSEMMRIEPFQLANSGSVQASFTEIPLQLQYELFGKLCLVWVVD